VANATGTSSATLPERLAARRDTLSPAEQSVAAYMADNPQEVAFASAEELGRLTGTSDATVIRTVKSLGYPGLPSLKRVLRESLREQLTPASRLSRRLDAIGDNRENIFDLVVSEQIRVLETARRTIHHADFAKAVEALRGARVIVTCSVGVMAPLAEFVTVRSMRQGRQARAVSASGFMLADALVPLAAEDAVILIAYGRLQSEDQMIIEHAGRVGCRLVVITDTLREAVVDRAAAVLSADVGPHEGLSSMTTAATILEALLLAYAASERTDVSTATDRLVELRKRLSQIVSDDLALSRRERPRRPR
jgi:DNA-binding MurR/RpiR family transcriptional regulator